MRFAMLLLCAAALPAYAAETAAEIQRPAAAPQAAGVVHTLRGIPEACVRLQGEFTGDAARPYAFAVVRTSPNCQARARFVDARKYKPDVAGGWVFNDVIRVPSAACPGQQAVVRVWRHPAKVTPPTLDAQGRARIYLQESMARARATTLPPVAMYAAAMQVEGTPCR